ncbi:AMP-binding protein [Priestia flexa]|uniref:AMP-binding protein n=1 Tax=Priestia flexa TaxID=86664 RepID=UPI000C24D64A|nr:AMP-binding protein [Priestia flexa]MEC0665834.1 AMP-binding protein [Priestia flexa]
MFGSFSILTDKEPKSIDAMELAEHELDSIKNYLNSARVVCLSGDDQSKIASIAVFLLNSGHKVILLPEGVDKERSMDPHVSCNLAIHCNQEGTSCELQTNSLDIHKYIWDLVYFTSGSTGISRPIGVSKDQLMETVKQYQIIYSVTANSVIYTTLKSTYNFTFVAGILLAAYANATFCYFADEQELIEYVEKSAYLFDRQVMLANPIVIQEMYNSGRSFNPKLLVDSGGAPLSTTAIQLFRERIGDLREGYGLTETCSLTHFDYEGTLKSLGTVGTRMPFVEHWSELTNDKPLIYLKSTNIGLDLSVDSNAQQFPLTICTGDIGKIDSNDQLRILGRSDDYAVNGFWPRDTLDVIGELLGFRCALVRHPSNKEVIVKLWGYTDNETIEHIGSVLQEKLGISQEQFIITCVNDGMLHSKKIPRN